MSTVEGTGKLSVVDNEMEEAAVDRARAVSSWTRASLGCESARRDCALAYVRDIWGAG